MKTNVSMRVCPLPSSLLSLQKSRGSVLGGSRLVGFMQRLANMPQASLHAEILSDNILDAQQAPGFDNWAAGVHKQYTSLGMASPFWVGGSNAPFAPHGLLGMSSIASLIALILVIFGLNIRSCFMRHMVPCVPSCGTRIRSLFVL